MSKKKKSAILESGMARDSWKNKIFRLSLREGSRHGSCPYKRSKTGILQVYQCNDKYLMTAFWAWEKAYLPENYAACASYIFGAVFCTWTVEVSIGSASATRTGFLATSRRRFVQIAPENMVWLVNRKRLSELLSLRCKCLCAKQHNKNVHLNLLRLSV